MKKNLIYSISIFHFYCCSALFAQADLGVPASSGKGGTATTILKNWEAIGINPSNLGWKENKTFSLGAFHSVGISIQTPPLNYGKLINGMLNSNDSLSSEDKIDFSDFFTMDNGISMQAHVNWLAASTQLPKIGGIALNIRDRIYGHLFLNPNLADVLFNGFNAESYIDSVTPNLKISTFTDGTQINFLHYRECNIAYGRKVISFGHVDFFAGLGYKRLWGLGYVNVDIKEDVFVAQSAFSNRYNINHIDSTFGIQDVDKLFNNVGSGNAFDAGVSAIVKNMFKFGISITDMGSIKWTDNTLSAYDTLVPVLDSSLIGIETLSPSDVLNVLFGENGMIQFNPSPAFSSALPTRLRLGAGIKFTKLLELAGDVVIPLNNAVGNLKYTYFAFGGEVNIVGTLKLNTGFSTSKEFGYSIPLGIGFGTAGMIEFNISTNDVLTWIGESKHPQASLIIGSFRFNLP